MNPVEFDGCALLMVTGELIEKGTRIVVEGVGAYNGEQFEINQNGGTVFDLTPFIEQTIARPLTGKWKKKFPQSDYYLVVDAEVKLQNC